jgi:hypothetical protein
MPVAGSRSTGASCRNLRYVACGHCSTAGSNRLNDDRGAGASATELDMDVSFIDTQKQEFFFEKKNQKAFANLASALRRKILV